MRELARVLGAFALVERFARILAVQVRACQALLAVAVLVELAHFGPSVRIGGIVAVRAVIAVSAVAFSEELADGALRPAGPDRSASSDRRLEATSLEAVFGR